MDGPVRRQLLAAGALPVLRRLTIRSLTAATLPTRYGTGLAWRSQPPCLGVHLARPSSLCAVDPKPVSCSKQSCHPNGMQSLRRALRMTSPSSPS